MSAVTENNYISNGSRTDYSFTFPYLKTSDVTVSLDGVTTSNFTFLNATTIQLNNGATPPVATAPANGVKIRILRETTVDNLTATFYAGSAIKSEDLNDNFTQNLFVTQEVNQRYLPTTGGTFTGNLNLGNNKITDLGNAVNTNDAVNKATLQSAIETDVLAGTDLSKTASGGQVTINHDVTGANSTINNSNGNVIQDLTISAQGHVTSAGSVDLDGRYYTETELDAGQLDTRYYTETQLDAGALDSLFFRQDSSETITSGVSWSAGDTHVATTAAIDARIIDLVDEVGGFDIVNDEQSFPDTNPGGTTGQAAVLSIKAASTTLTPSGTTVTITNGNLANNANITITGVPSDIPSGFGFLVESTSTLHTYTFHRLVPKATEVTTVANNATAIAAAGNNLSDILAVKNNEADIDAVALYIGNVNDVGTNIANVNTVAQNLTSVNAFADTYRIASSDPSARADGSSLQEGDLYFNTTSDELKVYNGGTWQGGVTASGNFAVTTGNTFTGTNSHNDNVKSRYGTGNDLEIFHNTTDSIINSSGTGSLKLQDQGNTKVEITSTGATVTGGVTATSFTGSAANLTNLPSANLTGALPAIDGSALTGLGTGFTGGGSEELFTETAQVMNSNFTTTTGKNYLGILPLTLNATLTVTSGSNMSFV